MPRPFRLIVLLASGCLAAPGSLARSAPPEARTRYAESRRLLEAGAFERALRRLATHSPAELEQDREGLTLRGLAHWGLGLDRFSTLAVQVGRLELVSRVRQLAAQVSREHPPGTSIGDRLARALPELETEFNRQSQLAGEVGRRGDESCNALRQAEADFARAKQLPPTPRARWCEAPERWLLLARAHRFCVEQERAAWGRDITGAGLAGLTTPERQQREQRLQELEKAFLEELDRQLGAPEGKPLGPPTLHGAADALLAFGLSSRRIARWSEAGGPHPLPAIGSDVAAKVPLRETRALISRDTVQAVIQLYRLCAEPRGGSTAADTAYTNYLFELRGGEVTFNRLAALAGELRPQEVAANPLFPLEKARLLSREEGQEEAVRNVLTQLGAGRLRRPVWTAAPAPIRTAFLRLPQWLRYGNLVSVSFAPILEKPERRLRGMDVPEAQAQLQQQRLKLGMVLATSDLPWDRETGYELAGSALGKLEKLAGAPTAEQPSPYAALHARLQTTVRQERFPAQLGAVLSDGRVAWMTDPTIDLKLSNPLVVVHRDGFFLKAAPPRPQ